MDRGAAPAKVPPATAPTAPTAATITPVRALFIANRGEIATRIARTARGLGIGTIVPGRAGAPEVNLLDGAAVVAAARDAGANALHPGYGFLAESAAFAHTVIAAGIRWVGPPPDAILTMGDKAGARRLAASLGVPVLPGYDEPDQSDAALTGAAARIGTPLLVKPAAGGGGKGMRIVLELAALPDAIAAARREARASFGDDRLVLERYLEGPRHVEIQVLFDAHGAGVHLGERDCSLQRRHQKVLEETPSPAVDDALRRRMGDAALRLAAAVGYAGAGTCEFLLEDDGHFFFLEMNTRLQVEHPVTEFVTGRDLVADQLRIAAGEPLGITQEDADAARTSGGHAVEVRLYAEDPETGFLPATGRVQALRWPAGEGTRVDAGIEVGTEVGGRFDPLLAKVIAHGRDRAEAFERLSAALDGTAVLGLVTNLRFLRWLVREPAVLAGQARIDTLERIWPPAGRAERAGPGNAAWETAARALLDATGPAAGVSDPWAGGWRLNADPIIRLAAEGEERMLAVRPPAPSDADSPAHVLAGETVHVDVAGRSVVFQPAPPPDVDRAVRAAAAHHAGGSATLEAPMPGVVLAVHMAEGTSVETGDPIVTLEAMKMEHVVVAPTAGRLTEIAVRPADQVSRGQQLATIEP